MNFNDPEVVDSLWWSDMMKDNKQQEKEEISDFVYNGRQETYRKEEPYVDLYTCLHKNCGTTLVVRDGNKLLDHLKERHHARYYQAIKKMADVASQRFLEYIIK